MGRPRIMGIVNVTPDSFSDGGQWAATDAAIAHALELVDQGADVIDVGGESTRPGALRVDEDAELARVLPVVAALAAEGVVVSVDTMRSGVAAETLAAGASIINDVSGGLADAAMTRTVADAGAIFVAMHWRGESRTMQQQASYPRGVVDIVDELRDRRDAALAAGIAPERLVLDPGIGFAKTADHNWAVLRAWDRFEALGHPLLLAVSRKRFLGTLLGTVDAPRPPVGRDTATAALSALFAGRQPWGIRVHDVRATADALAAASALAADSRTGSARLPETVTVTLTGVTAVGHHGVFSHERRDGQRFVVDAELTLERPEVADDLATTVDYGALAAAIAANIARDPVDLIETLAGRIADELVATPLVAEARVTVHKPSAPIPVPFGDVAVTLTRRSTP